MDATKYIISLTSRSIMKQGDIINVTPIISDVKIPVWGLSVIEFIAKQTLPQEGKKAMMKHSVSDGLAPFPLNWNTGKYKIYL